MAIVKQYYTPKPGDIGLVRIAGGVGLGIRFGQWLTRATWKFWTWRKLWKKAKYEHAFMVSRVSVPPLGSIKRTYIIEAEPGGATERPLHYDPASILWLKAPNVAMGLRAAEWVMWYEGVGYSFLDYLAIFLHSLGFNFKWLRNYIESTHHMICSQLVDLAADMAGWHLFGKDAIPPSEPIWDGFVIPEMEAELAELQALQEARA